MKVTAKCLFPTWASNECCMYEPGMGPLPGGLYEIERDSDLAEMKFGQQVVLKRNPEGRIVSAESVGGKHVFEFDRNANPADTPHDYSCKEDGCGAIFKSLPALGSHTKSAHRVGTHTQVAEEEEPFADRTCPECARVCKSVYGLSLHREKAHQVARKAVDAKVAA